MFPTLNFRGFFITKHSEDPGESWKGSGRGSGKGSGRGSGSPEWWSRARSVPKSQFCEEVVKGKGILFEGTPGGFRDGSGRDPG